jgi:hypothetical protein
MRPLPGTSALLFCVSIEKSVKIGKLGTLLVEPDFYIASEKFLDKFTIGDIH